MTKLFPRLDLELPVLRDAALSLTTLKRTSPSSTTPSRMRPDLSRGIAIETIVSTLKDLSDGVHEKGAFSWSFGKFACHLADDADYEELRANFRAAQSVEELLREMLASGSAAVKSLKPKFDDMANQRKFNALPDEILATVFEMDFNRPSDRWDRRVVAERLSLVSRRFRRIVLGSPVLWSSINSTFQSLKKAKLFASRTTAPIISLSINGGESKKKSEEIRILGMYRLAISISSRIQSFNICISNDESSYLQQIVKISSNVSLPVLSELSLECYSNVSRNYRNLCYSWDMPSLKKLRVLDFLPKLPSDVLSRIRECSIEANRSSLDGEEIWSTKEIMTLLLSLTCVVDLRVAVRLPSAYDWSKRGTRMASVENLTLVLQNTEVAMDESILHFVQFPSIKSFNLDLGLKQLENLEDALEQVVFKSPPTSVTEVSLTVSVEYENYNGRMPTFMVGEWCKVFGHLKSLTLETKRHKTHGLLSFASSVDAVKIVDFAEDDTLGDLLAELPFMWDYTRPHRTAIMTAEELGLNQEDKLRFVERSYSDSD